MVLFIACASVNQTTDVSHRTQTSQPGEEIEQVVQVEPLKIIEASKNTSSIDYVISDLVVRLKDRLKPGLRLAIVNVSSPSINFSDYVV
jgi:hypothetical protein